MMSSNLPTYGLVSKIDTLLKETFDIDVKPAQSNSNNKMIVQSKIDFDEDGLTSGSQTSCNIM